MDSVCYSCGSHVIEQAPFCASCGAPQIRVPSRESAVEELTQPAAEPVSAHPVAPPPMLLRVGETVRIHWKTFFRIALPLAAVVGISQVVFPPLTVLLLPGSVIIAIHLYRRRQPIPLRATQGAKMGAATAFASFAFYAVTFAIRVAADPAAFRHDLATAVALNPNPDAQQMGQALINSTGGLVIFFVLMMLVSLMFLLVIGSISGALTARFSKEKST